MMDTHKLAKFSSTGIFAQARQIVAAATILLALTLAGPPRLWGQCGDHNSNSVAASVAVSPGSVVGNSGRTMTATITVAPVVTGSFAFQSVGVSISGVSGWITSQLIDGAAPVWCGSSTTTVQFQVGSVSHLTTGTFRATANGGTVVANFDVIPTDQPVDPSNLGPANCVNACGSPINLADGNVWIPQRDYVMPGLGGGLELSRVWNSRWGYAGPPALAGMFGFGWRSTYEEQLYAADAQTLEYWRGDGSAWTFTYNPVLSSYSLASPPNERAQLVMNSGNGGFTLTLADGAQRLFNNQNLLAAIVDRNGNQTTIAYDGYNRIASVSSPGGKTLTFAYGDSNNPMQATTAQDGVGTVATYTYDSSSRLTQVTYADSSTLNFTYDPNSSMILSVTDGQGKLLESHTYDSQNRGLTSARAYGVDSVSLTY